MTDEERFSDPTFKLIDFLTVDNGLHFIAGLHVVDGNLCACSHGLACGPLNDQPNIVIPDQESDVR